MSTIISVLTAYMGQGLYVVAYVVLLILLLSMEKNKGNRILFGYLPLVLTVLFFLPPVYKLYSKIDGADTYYRFLWLLPMTVTIVYTEARFLLGTSKGIKTTIAGLGIVTVIAGRCIYFNPAVIPAENRLHIPNHVISVCDTILNDTEGETAMAAMPSELVQFVRQYDTRIMMPYGREMLMPAYEGYYNAVYRQMEETDPIDAKELAKVIRDNYCSHVVINAARRMKGNLEEEGLILVSDLGAYRVYKDPENELMIFN